LLRMVAGAAGLSLIEPAFKPGWRSGVCHGASTDSRIMGGVLVRIFAPMAVLLSSVWAVYAQNQPLPPELQRRAYVRRISAGATLSVPVFTQFVTGFDYFSQTTPPLESAVDSKTKRHWAGGGGMVQVAILERLSVNVGALYRKAEFNSERNDLAGVDNPNTLIDDRVRTTTEEWTRVRYLDIPVLARYYTKGRHQRGDRWFFQAGPNLRTIQRLRNTVRTTAQDGTATTSALPEPPSTRRVMGITAGFGAQFIDPVGVRVVPEVRYTRWMDPSFRLFGTQSRRDHLEVMISLTF